MLADLVGGETGKSHLSETAPPNIERPDPRYDFPFQAVFCNATIRRLHGLCLTLAFFSFPILVLVVFSTFGDFRIFLFHNIVISSFLRNVSFLTFVDIRPFSLSCFFGIVQFRGFIILTFLGRSQFLTLMMLALYHFCDFLIICFLQSLHFVILVNCALSHICEFCRFPLLCFYVFPCCVFCICLFTRC